MMMLVACSGGAPPSKNAAVCDSLAIASEVSKRMLDYATEQYVSAEHAFDKWEHWRLMPTKPEHDSGELADAGNRANSYRATGDALCKTAALNYWQMHELARVFAQVSVLKELAPLANTFGPKIECGGLDNTPLTNDASKRKAFFDEWRARTLRVQEVAMAAVSECYSITGGTRPAVIVPETSLPGE